LRRRLGQRKLSPPLPVFLRLRGFFEILHESRPPIIVRHVAVWFIKPVQHPDRNYVANVGFSVTAGFSATVLVTSDSLWVVEGA
jgi:hypothetical protein